MFVKWRARPSAKTNRPGVTTLSAVLVENHRQGGRIRQKYRKSLGSLRTRPGPGGRRDMTLPSGRVCDGDRWEGAHAFWLGVAHKLNALDLPPALRRRLERDVVRVVPKPEVTP